MTLSEATQAVYLESLRKLSFSEITRAAQRTIEEWDKPCMMPPLAFILSRTDRQPGEEAQPECLTRGDKPDDWEYVSPEALHALTEQVLEVAKAKQMPTYSESCEAQAKQRNVTSTIPADPEERRTWAHKKAIEQGWIK